MMKKTTDAEKKRLKKERQELDATIKVLMLERMRRQEELKYIEEKIHVVHTRVKELDSKMKFLEAPGRGQEMMMKD